MISACGDYGDGDKPNPRGIKVTRQTYQRLNYNEEFKGQRSSFQGDRHRNYVSRDDVQGHGSPSQDCLPSLLPFRGLTPIPITTLPDAPIHLRLHTRSPQQILEKKALRQSAQRYSKHDEGQDKGSPWYSSRTPTEGLQTASRSSQPLRYSSHPRHPVERSKASSVSSSKPSSISEVHQEDILTLTKAVEEEIKMKLHYLEMIHGLQQGHIVVDIEGAEHLEKSRMMNERMMRETRGGVKTKDYPKEKHNQDHGNHPGHLNRRRPINRQLMANILSS